MSTMQRYLLLILVFAQALTSVWAEPGGKGKLENNTYSNNCFKPNSGTVVEVCAEYEIRWKLWSLMGEPVGNYVLSWRLTSLELMDPQRKLIATFNPSTLPNALQKPASKIELYIDATSFVNGRPNVRHRFNTGVAVRAGGQRSYNVPGSPSWNALFISSGNPCDDKQVQYLEASAAQSIFKGGVLLGGLDLCPGSGVSELTFLESAIGNLCKKSGADKSYTFCPVIKDKKQKDEAKSDVKGKADTAAKPQKQLGASLLDGDATAPTDTMQNLLDEKAEQPQVQTRLNKEIAIFRNKVEPGCQNALRQINSCYAKTGCSRPAENPSPEECQSIPPYPQIPIANTLVLTKVPQPGDICYNEDDECRAAKAEWAAKKEERRREEVYEIEQQQAEWKAEYGSLSATCRERNQERNAFASCQKQYDATCNPQGLNTVEDCINEQVRTRGPTQSDARKLLQKEWSQPKKSKEPDAPHNFLDD